MRTGHGVGSLLLLLVEKVAFFHRLVHPERSRGRSVPAGNRITRAPGRGA
jgi:hypothetical protein